jgi:beta-galactosidase
MLGVAFYPEHWPEERFPTDLGMMVEARVKLVRMGEFSWTRMEPREGEFNFSWLLHYIRELNSKGIRSVIGTPTASPPPWAIRSYPDILPVDFNGIRPRFGTRRQYCPNNPNYRRLSERIARELARAVSEEEGVVGFQVDNELSLGWNYCYCDHCVRGFREYLRSKYGTLGDLNEKWGTVFWGHEYNDWEEIHPPSYPYDYYNRGLALDWVRFRSSSMLDYLRLQVEVIREEAPGKFITTNLMGLYPELDYYSLGREVDFPSTDVYPKYRVDYYDPSWIAMIYDATRCMGKGDFWVMEMQAGPTDGGHGTGIGASPEPGEMRKWFYQALAHGSSANLFFNWRTSPRGKEQFWHGVLNHDGLPNRRYEELKQIGREVEALGEELKGYSIGASVALLFSYESMWTSDVVEGGYYPMTYYEVIRTAYRGLWREGIPVDVVGPASDLSKYSTVLAPFLYLCGETLLRKLRDFVTRGGKLILTARSLIKDDYNRVATGAQLEDFWSLTGVRVEDYTKLPANVEYAEVDFPQMRVRVRWWIEALSPLNDARVIATHSFREFKGKPAAASRGGVTVFGFFPPEEVYAQTVKGEERWGVGDQEVEVVKGEVKGKWVLFLINHSSSLKRLEVDLKGREWYSILSRREFKGRTQVELGPHGVEVMKSI